MYIDAQPDFFNAVAQIHTSLAPVELLEALKDIEKQLGRDPLSARNGPRPIDLDIVLYGSRCLRTDDGRLTIPHPRICEREFVLRPLCDIDSSVSIPVEAGGASHTAGDLLQQLQNSKVINNAGSHPKDCFGGSSTIARVMPLRRATRGHLIWNGRPKLMGIVNVTPDSFSDGGSVGKVDDVLRLVEQFVEHEFDIIDVRQYCRNRVVFRERRSCGHLRD